VGELVELDSAEEVRLCLEIQRLLRGASVTKLRRVAALLRQADSESTSSSASSAVSRESSSS
jgi:hypothetical protein